MFEKPYSPPLGPPVDINGVECEVVARVQMARSARTWLPDIEAYLVEQGLTTEIAPVVADLMDASGWSMESTVAAVATAL